MMFRTITNDVIKIYPRGVTITTMAEEVSVGFVEMATDKEAPGFKEVRSRKRRKDRDMDTGEEDVTLMETAAKRPAFPPVDDTTALVRISSTLVH